MKDYHINVFYSEEDASYVAGIPDLQYCSAFGDTSVEALTEVRRVMTVWMDAAKEEGKPVLPPRYRPAICPLA